MPPASSTNRSTRMATARTPTRMISGAKAWASNVGGVKARMSGASMGSVAGSRGPADALAHLAERFGDGGGGDVEDQARHEAEHDDQDQDGHPGDPLGGGRVVDVGIVGELGLGSAEGDPLVEPEQVAGGEDGADGGDDHERAEQPLAQRAARFVGRED